MALCIPFVFILQFQGLTQILGVIAFLIILFFAISIFFIKKGIVKDNYGLHIGYYSWSKLIYKDPIAFMGLPAVTLLKFRKKSRGANITYSPDFSNSINSFEIYLLDNKHTVKRKILTLKDEDRANATIQFIAKHSKLRHEIYSPDFS